MLAYAKMLATSPPPATVLSIGVITVSDQIDRRMLLRAAWLHKPWAGDGGPVAAHFVIRGAGAPPWLDEQLRSEEAHHGDILRVPVPWDESRLKGPLLTLAAFITHEARRAAARYIAKVDDDAFVHVADLLALTRRLGAAVPDRMQYVGMLTWNSWFPEKWDRFGFGWTHRDALRSARRCRNATWVATRCGDGCGTCSGPFPFMAGYLIVLSAPLAVHMAGALPAEVARLAPHTERSLVTNGGYQHSRIFEDIWLGSFLHRFPPQEPLSYVTTGGSGLVNDLEQRQWQSVLMPSFLTLTLTLTPTLTPTLTLTLPLPLPLPLPLTLTLALALALALTLSRCSCAPPCWCTCAARSRARCSRSAATWAAPSTARRPSRPTASADAPRSASASTTALVLPHGPTAARATRRRTASYAPTARPRARRTWTSRRWSAAPTCGRRRPC